MCNRIRRWLVTVLAATAVLIVGCSSPSTADVESADASLVTSLPMLSGSAIVELTVSGQPITIELNGADAPVTAGNFVDLVQRGVYDGSAFHRVVKSPDPFVVQGGDPQSKDPNVPPERLGTGGFIDPETSEPRYIPLEIKPQGAEEPIYSQTFEEAGISAPPALPHTRGAVAMARSAYPDSASSQFYITLADHSFLDGSYAVFGYVTQGMDVVDQIQQGDRIDAARVVTGLENLTEPAE